MSDQGNEEPPKLRVIQGGRSEGETFDSPYFDAVSSDMDQIRVAARLGRVGAEVNSYAGPYKGYTISFERRTAPGTRSIIFTLFHPDEDPTVVLEGFTLKDSIRHMSDEERYVHTEIQKSHGETVDTGGAEAKAKINATLLAVKQVLGIGPRVLPDQK